MRKQYTVFTWLMCLLLLAPAAFGQMMGPGSGAGTGSGPGYGAGPGYGGGPGHGSGMWNNYRATPEQQQAFQGIMEKYQAPCTELAEKIWAKRALLNGLLAQEKIDRKQVQTLAKEVGALMAQAYEMQVEMLADMREKGLSHYGMGMMGGGMMGGRRQYPGMMQ